MKIETELSPGDVGWFLAGDRVTSSRIIAIQVRSAVDDFEPKECRFGADPFKKCTLGVFYYTQSGHRLRDYVVYKSREELGTAVSTGTYGLDRSESDGN